MIPRITPQMTPQEREYVRRDCELTELLARQCAEKKKQEARRLAQQKKRRRDTTIAWLVLIGIVVAIFGCGTLYGWHLGTVHAEKPPVETVKTVDTEKQAAPAPTATALSTVQPEPLPLPVRDDIVSDGTLLTYDLQLIMQAYCEQYQVPYALALAVADRESRFNPDAISGTNDFGLMQINKINHGWLNEKGIDPLSYEGNIEAGVLMLSQAIEKYGDYELALMAYNCGDAGAKRLWNEGTYSTKYSRAVMELYQKWAAVLEDT